MLYTDNVLRGCTINIKPRTSGVMIRGNDIVPDALGYHVWLNPSTDPALPLSDVTVVGNTTPAGTIRINGTCPGLVADFVAASAPAKVATPAAPAIVGLTGTPLGTTGSFQASGNTIAKVFDGDLSTYFDGPVADGCWVGIDLGQARTLATLSFAPRPGWGSRMVGGTFTASNSADFSGAMSLYTVTTTLASGTLTTVPVPATVGPVRYLRYQSPKGSFGNIAAMQVLGN